MTPSFHDNYINHLFVASLTLLFPPRSDPNRTTEGCDKTPIEIAMGAYIFIDGECVHYKHNFEMLMILAGFVNAETSASTKLDILEVVLQSDDKAGNYPEQFEKNLMDISVSEA